MTLETPQSLAAVTLIPAAECGLMPVAPGKVARPDIPVIPQPTAPDYLVTRTKAAEVVAIYAIQQRDAERDARETNAATQEKCAKWAKAQGN
jgi:hypothetical protein